MMEFPNFILPPIEKGKFMSIIMNRPAFARSERQHFPRIRPLTAEEPNGGNGRGPSVGFPAGFRAQKLLKCRLS